jgi:hypothetical protein
MAWPDLQGHMTICRTDEEADEARVFRRSTTTKVRASIAEKKKKIE